MPKLKTNRGAKKRFRVTATGKIKRPKCNRRHILTSKAKKMKRQLKSPSYVSSANMRNIKKLLPHI